MKTEDLKELLYQSWELLSHSTETLNQSLNRCKQIDLESVVISTEDSDALDALTSKFARCSDIFTQKVLNTVLLLKRVTAPTFVDKMNNCEKIGIISHANEMIEIRDLRNEISHEYWMDNLRKQQKFSIKIIPSLFKNIDLTKEYLINESLLDNQKLPK